MMEKNVCNKNGYHVDLCSTRRLKIWEKNIFIQWIKKNQSFFLPIYKFICAHNKVYSFYCFVFVVRISDVQSGPIVIWDFLKETASAKYCFFFLSLNRFGALHCSTHVFRLKVLFVCSTNSMTVSLKSYCHFFYMHDGMPYANCCDSYMHIFLLIYNSHKDTRSLDMNHEPQKVLLISIVKCF